MWRTLILLAIILGVLAFIFYTFFTYFLGISGTKSAFQKDLEEFRLYLQSVALSPWDLGELDILSRKGISQINESLFATTEKGQIHSIYDEPIIAYAVKSYRSTNKKSMAVRINDDIFHFELKGKRIFVFDNDLENGSIQVSDALRFTNDSVELEIPHLSKTTMLPVRVNDKHVWSVRSYEENGEDSRVIETLQKYESEQARLFLATLAFAIVDEQI